MARKFYRLAVVAAVLQVVGCAVVQPESSCCCVDPCFVEGDGQVVDGQCIDDDLCRHCGRGPSVSIAQRCGLAPLMGLLHGHHHDVAPTPVEPAPTPPTWTRFHPVPTRPVFEPAPYYLPPSYGEPIPSTRQP